VEDRLRLLPLELDSKIPLDSIEKEIKQFLISLCAPKEIKQNFCPVEIIIISLRTDWFFILEIIHFLIETKIDFPAFELLLSNCFKGAV
jgi:hypothetical protein